MIRPDLASLPHYVPGKRNPVSLKLSSNEVNYGPLDSVQEKIVEASTGVNRYPNFGVTELRSVLADSLGLESMDWVATGVGSSALCQQLVQITCSAPTDEVLFPWRSFEAYPIFAQVHGARPVAIPLDSDQRVDLDAIAAAINENTKLIFICNPNNPTGTLITKKEFTDFMSAVPENIIVALDEAYFEYIRETDTPHGNEVVKEYSNVIALRTFSKAYGLAGLRVGYAFGNPTIIAALNAVALPFGVNSIAQAAARACLEPEAQQELLSRTNTTVEAREMLVERLGAVPSSANFIWFPGLGKEIADALTEEGILVRSFPEGIRVTVTDHKEMDIFLAAWEKVHAQ